MQNTYSPALSETAPRIEYLEIEPEFQKTQKAKSLPSYMPIVQFLMGGIGRLLPNLTAKIAFRIFRTPRSKAKHRVSDKVLEAAKISEILVGANILKVYDWGAGDKNVLLVHGWESRGTAMRSFVQPLVAKGYRVIAFDGPAHGNSTGKRTNILEFAEAIKAIITRLGSVDAVITHSFGGMCLAYASRKLMPKTKLPKVVMTAVPTDFDDIILKIKTIMNFPNSVVESVNEMIEKIAGEKPSDLTVPKAAGKTQIEDLLVVHDTNDSIVEFKYAERILETWNNSKLLVTEGLGHYRILKHKKVLEKIVSFIAD